MTVHKPRRRFKEHKPAGSPRILAAGHPAVVEGRPLFTAHRLGAIESRTLDFPPLKSGAHSRKIGSHVVKGAWSGMPIYTLTLKERTTCPRSCKLWRSCYGNKMPFAPRQDVNGKLMVRLHDQLGALSRAHPKGFVVRLHVLGDFASVAYVQWWFDWLEGYPALRIFGYTAWQPFTAIGKAVDLMNARYPDRCRIRFSNPPSSPVKVPDAYTATTIPGYHGETAKAMWKLPKNVIICPAQTGKTDCCGTCALCWSTTKQIAFLQH